MPKPLAYESPQAALDALRGRLAPRGSETIAFAEATGRVLAEPLRADRDSPSCDVSAMDGFALRSADSGAPLPIAGAIAIGQPPPALPPGAALRIVTGAPIPDGADSVVRHEDTHVDGDRLALRLPGGAKPKPGDNIRRRGENIAGGETIVPPGTLVTPAVAAALAHVGAARVVVHQRVRVALLATGDELQPIESNPSRYQLRDSNGPALASLFADLRSVAVEAPRRVGDSLDAIQAAIAERLERSDLLLLSGGVSMGERDFVPDALRAVGVEILFHRLPQRPGRPILGGIGPQGQAVLALPGNPVSVLVTARRFAIATARRLAGLAGHEPIGSVVVADSDASTLPLWWHRLVRLDGVGRAVLVRGKGSGDLVGAARSDGFIEVPPNQPSVGPWPFYPWQA